MEGGSERREREKEGESDFEKGRGGERGKKNETREIESRFLGQLKNKHGGRSRETKEIRS